MTQLASHDTSSLGAINAGIHGGHLPKWARPQATRHLVPPVGRRGITGPR
jgi:hypothetical protein